ncbi:helix-turn-helix domain-containing protein [Pseudomonas sp. NY15437]|uniref:helix-turn-helix domain-containing protein n=1 Tax=unclassified Pseudomonas TaxID=196821 RepID=UPI00223B4733|nr:helix-turn-helix domain-containing protein [Pseudomonas sp. GCEP-101]
MKEGSGFTPDLRAGGYYVTPERFAQLIGLGDRQSIVHGWIDQGELPSRCIGGQLLVDLGALLSKAPPGHS